MDDRIERPSLHRQLLPGSDHRQMAAGETVEALTLEGESVAEVVLVEDIPTGHHVHVHNVKTKKW